MSTNGNYMISAITRGLRHLHVQLLPQPLQLDLQKPPDTLQDKVVLKPQRLPGKSSIQIILLNLAGTSG